MRKTAILAAMLLLLSCAGGRGRYVQISGYAQGGTYTVKLNMKGVTVSVETIRDSIDAILNGIDTTLSGYNRNSLLSRFNEGEKIRPNAMFLEMYRMGYDLWKSSGGVLDFAAGPIYDAWGFGFRSSSFPSDSDIAALRENCGMRLLPPELPVRDGILDPSELGNPRLNYNAIAQGYSCDRVAAYLYSIGIKDMLVDIGEIWCDGLNPGGKPWAVGIDCPEDNQTEEKIPMETVWSGEGKPFGIVTSGNYRKFYVKDGRKYAHTIDPVSGYPVNHSLLSATVVSSVSSAQADAYATWCMVLGIPSARELILGDPTLEGSLIFETEDGSMHTWISPGFTVRKQ
ncbi:MAG: FAD:protein FMN transferase [Bacteroidales bacterium]|nr:FAD:protein FMN transferase [Bacteroidales bacterium]